jgi:starvation-inducible DNA-binding protein
VNHVEETNILENINNSMEQLLLSSKISFASSYAFVLKAQNYHWNVEGMFFVQLHDLFGKIYEEAQENIDVFAEQIRTLDSYVPGSFARLSELSKIEDEIKIPTAKIMVERLLSDNEVLISSLNETFELAEEFNQQGFVDFIAGRIDAHKKHSWMLRSILKERT